MKRLVSLSLLLIFFTIPCAYAQPDGTVKQCLPSFSEFKPVPGGWAEYLVKTSGDPVFRVRIAVVGKEGPDYWYETVVWAGGRIVTKVLAAGDPNNEKNVKKMIVKYGDDPATEVPVVMKELPQQKGKPVRDIKDKGPEDIKVLAGTFTTKHLQYQENGKTTDTWENSCVSPYGLIRLVSSDMEMVLLGYGTGAKSLITETPKVIK
jgi:hypothetical protein